MAVANRPSNYNRLTRLHNNSLWSGPGYTLKEDRMSDVTEGWITWDAIPPQFNRYMELNIFHMVWAYPKVAGAFAGVHSSRGQRRR